MNSKFGFVLALSFFSYVPVSLAEVTSVPLEKVFAPVGFDSNDNVEVILRGRFPTTCYTLNEPQVSIGRREKIITLTLKAQHRDGAHCYAMRTPFLKSVKLGQLDEGTYTVRVEGSPALNTTLEIGKPGNTEADDFSYANVTSAEVQISADGVRTLELKGTHPLPADDNACVILSSVSVLPMKNGVTVVLPQTQFELGSACYTEAANPVFSYKAILGSDVGAESLVHIRTLYGNSLNVLVP